MPRKKLIVPNERLEVQVRQDLMAKLKLELFSDLEGRVPHGALSRLLEQLIADHLNESAELYLQPYFNHFSPGSRIRGDRATIEALRTLLEGATWQPNAGS